MMEGLTATPTCFELNGKGTKKVKTVPTFYLNRTKRPSKNLIHCPQCGRQKMLFQTEAEALRFIAYNGEDIRLESGFAPTRAYYCEACGGYHLTSQERGELLGKRLRKSAQHRKLSELKQRELERLAKAEEFLRRALKKLQSQQVLKARKLYREAAKLFRYCDADQILSERKQNLRVNLEFFRSLCDRLEPQPPLLA